jgi:hypothetical protein
MNVVYHFVRYNFIRWKGEQGMRKTRWMIVLPVLLVSTMACGLLSGIQKVRQAATELPGMLTAAPTVFGPMETAAAKYTPESDSTPSDDGLGIPFSRPEAVLKLTQEFTFESGTVDDQPAQIATLTSAGKAAFSHVKDFKAEFIGDPKNLSRIVVSAASGDATVMEENSALGTIVIGSSLPPDAKFEFLSWLSANYQSIQKGSTQETTIKNIHFTIKVEQNSVVVELQPAAQ